jgi:dTDP-4-dehydrorhamnose reductase
MRVLILGAKGNLGGQLVKVFSTKENEVIDWDKGEIDITDRELILKKVNDIKPDIIINAAAYNAVDKCEESGAQYEIAKKINIDGPKFLAEAAIAVGAVLVHYSSDYVFDGKKKNGYKETDKPNPTSKYGKTKLHGEKKIIEYSGSGLKWYLIRSSKLFGPKGDSEQAKESFFDLMLRLSDERKEFNMVEGAEISCFTYTPDLAVRTKELVDGNFSYGIYHIVNAEPSSWYKAAKFLFELTGKNDIKLNPIKPEEYPRPAKRPAYSILLNTKLEPLRSWKEALMEYLKK